MPGRITTRADYEIVRQGLMQELQKPREDMDLPFVQSATAELRAAEQYFAPGQLPEGSAEAVAAGAMEQQQMPSGMTQMPQQEALQLGARSRMQAFGDLFRRPFMSEEERIRLNDQRIQQRAVAELELEEYARRNGVPVEAVRTDMQAGEFVPDIVAGFGPGALIRGPRIGSALLRIAGDTGVSTMASLASVPIGQDPGLDAILAGAVPGASFGVISELPGFAKAIVLDEALRAANNPQTRAARELSRSVGINLSLAEASQSGPVAAMEATIPTRAGSSRDRFYTQQQQQIFESMDSLQRQLNPENLSSGEIITAVQGAYSNHVRTLSNEASTRFVNSLRPAADALGATVDAQQRIIGGQRVVSVDNLLGELRTQRGLLNEAPRMASPSQITELDNAIDELLEAQSLGGMTLGKAQELLRQYTALAYPTGATVTRQLGNAVDTLNPRQLKDAMMADLQATADQIQSGAIPVSGRAAEAAAPSVETAYRSFMNASIRRYAMEEQGQGILDDLVEAAKSPRDVAHEFWRTTYPELSAEAQERFRRYASRLTGGTRPGDVIGRDANNANIFANDWMDVADFANEDLANAADQLQGEERGYVALMEWANSQRGIADRTLRSANAPSATALPPPRPNPALAAAAARSLLDARAQYAADMGVIDEFQSTAVDNLLGKVAGTLEPEQFTRNILNMPTAQLRQLIGLLETTKPGLANSMRSRIFWQIADNRSALLPRGASGYEERALDVAGFVGDLQRMPLDRYMVLTGLDAATANSTRDALKVLDLIAQGPQARGGAGGRGPLARLEELAINMASQNAGFVSRMLAGRLGPGFFERVLFTPEGVNALDTLGSSASTRTAMAGAFSTLGRIWLGVEEEKRQMIERAKQVEEQQRQERMLGARGIGPGSPAANAQAIMGGQ